jgi:hypothetical protein
MMQPKTIKEAMKICREAEQIYFQIKAKKYVFRGIE